VRLAIIWFRWVVAGLAVGLLLAVVAPRAIGWRALTVVSGSMTPTVRVGDVVVTRPEAPAHAAPGDVVTFVDPERNGRLVTHRVVRVHPVGSHVDFVTRGDANTASERWSVAAGGRIGVVQYRVPYVGRLILIVASACGRTGLIAIPALLWGALTLRSLWRQREDTTGVVADVA
jgi:signal peptidase